MINKKELVKETATKLGVTQKDTVKILDGLIDVITESLNKGETVNIVGFGKFYVKDIKPRELFDFSKNERFTTEPSVAPRFKFSKLLIDEIKNNK